MAQHNMIFYEGANPLRQFFTFIKTNITQGNAKDNLSNISDDSGYPPPPKFKSERYLDDQTSNLDAESEPSAYSHGRLDHLSISDDSKEAPPCFKSEGSLDGSKMSNDKQAWSGTEMKWLNTSGDDNSCSSYSHDPPYPGFGKFALDGSKMPSERQAWSRVKTKCLNTPGGSYSNEYPDYGKKVPLDWRCSDLEAEIANFLSEPNTSKKKYETEYHQSNLSFGMSVFNLINIMVGSSILGVSFAMANTGIAMFVILLSFVAIFSLCSVHLLLKTASEGGTCVYESLGYKAFGMPGKLAASCSITMQNIGVMSTYLFIIRYELPIVIQTFTGANNGEWYMNGDYLVLLVSVILILPLSLLKNLGCLRYTSCLSLLCIVFFLIVVIMKKFEIPCPLLLTDHVNEILLNITHHSDNTTTDDDTCRPKYFVFNSQTVYSILIVMFAFVCHPTILPTYKELKVRSRRKMQNVANVSFLAMFIMYLLAALLGYLTFNIHVEPELLHTYFKYFKHDVLLLVVRLAVLAAVTLTVPVVLFPIRTSISHLLFSTKDFSWIRHIIITVILLAGTNTLVIFVPSIRDIFGFIGASAAAMLIFILPSAFYIKLVKKESMMSMQKIGAVLFLILGFFVMFGCMTLILMDWISNSEVADKGH